tara:strand:+ start:296 stop:502 length:207 start_codon:yes stop_codon:yes gene_type:complete
MFVCPLCEDEWILSQRLCPDCIKLRRFMKLYGKSRVCGMIENILSVNDKMIELKTTKQIKDLTGNKLL